MIRPSLIYFTHLSLAVVLLAGGFMLGRVLTKEQEVNVDSFNRVGLSPAADREDANGKDDLSFLRDLHAKIDPIPAELGRSLERLDVAMLHSLILEHLRSSNRSGDRSNLNASELLCAAAVKELWARQGHTALQWAENIELAADRKEITKQLLSHGMAEDPEGVLPWMKDFVYKNERFLAAEIIKAASHGKASQSADELLLLNKILEELGFRGDLTPSDYAEGFDFSKVYSVLGYEKLEYGEFITNWAKRDLNEAWDAVHGEDDGIRNLGGFLRTAIAQQGETAGIDWIVGKLRESHSGEIESNVIDAMLYSRASPEGMARLAELVGPERRSKFAERFVRIYGLSTGAYTALDQLPREDRIEILSANKNRLSSRGGSSRKSGIFREMFTLSADHSQQLRRNLEERYQLTDKELIQIFGDEPQTKQLSPQDPFLPEENDELE